MIDIPTPTVKKKLSKAANTNILSLGKMITILYACLIFLFLQKWNVDVLHFL